MNRRRLLFALVWMGLSSCGPSEPDYWESQPDVTTSEREALERLRAEFAVIEAEANAKRQKKWEVFAEAVPGLIRQGFILRDMKEQP